MTQRIRILQAASLLSFVAISQQYSNWTLTNYTKSGTDWRTGKCPVVCDLLNNRYVGNKLKSN